MLSRAICLFGLRADNSKGQLRFRFEQVHSNGEKVMDNIVYVDANEMSALR